MCRKCCLGSILMLLIQLTAPDGLAQSPNRGMHVRFSLQSAPVTVTASGVVTDKQTGTPIAGAKVRAHIVVRQLKDPDSFERCPQGETLTDEAGRYMLEIRTPLTTTGPRKGKDRMCLYTSAPGYETMPQYIRPYVTPDATEFACDFALGAGRRVSGVLQDPDGRPVRGALLRVQNGYNGDWNFFGALGQTTTNEGGEFELWIAAEPREYLSRSPWLTILKRGQGAMFVWGLLERDDLGTLTLPACGTVAGRVVDGQGQAVPDCEVSVRGFPCGLIGTTRTDAAGQYVLSGIPGEPSIVDFYTRKNDRFIDSWGKVQVFARLDPTVDLKEAANYSIRAKDNETIAADDLLIAENSGVSGRLIAGGGSLGLGGLMVRLDGSWDTMVEADIEGNFHFRRVAPGEHKLTAYLPHNLRYDRGIGRTTISVTPGVPLEDVEIQIDDLAEQRVQYLDANGNPLPGIIASATWSPDGGGWTEGTVSDADGWAVLYLYSGDTQYIGGADRSGRFVAETKARIKPAPAAIMQPIQIVMVEAATLTGQLLDEQGTPVPSGRFTCRLAYADGTRTNHRIGTDEDGRFTLRNIVPGVVTLSLDTESLLYANVLGAVIEIEPGATKAFGAVSLANGLDKAVAIEQLFGQVAAEPTELLAAARRLLEAVRDADYTAPDAWRDFIEPEYCVYTNYPAWVQWICTNLKDNPIETIELGDVSRGETEGHWEGHQNIPTVDYKLTLRDGQVLQGVLQFDYSLHEKYWMGMRGLDWHLNDPWN